jgi:NAD dependent epimerase/dehydratase family enzyme
MSWVALNDLIRAIRHVLADEGLAGAVNAVAPNPATNREFTKTLGRLLRRPTIAPLPGFAARLAFGEMADQLLLAGARVIPQRLLDSGFEFDHPSLESALRAELAGS